jgi:CysZ protein
MAVNPVSGAAFLIQGMRLISRPGLRRFVIIPLLINIAVFSGAIYFGLSRFDQAVSWIESKLPDLPDWLSWLEQGLEWVLWPLFVLLIVIIVFYGFTLVANLIASPFNGLLAEKVELLLTGKPLDGGGGIKKVMIELVPTLVDELKKILYALLWSIPFLILAFILPVLGPAIWFLFTAWTLALEYSDFPMGNHGLRFREMRKRLRGRPVLSLGFGSATAALTMIPVLNFIAMPSAVAGATAMWVRELKTTETARQRVGER